MCCLHIYTYVLPEKEECDLSSRAIAQAVSHQLLTTEARIHY
jgi:hypothetical protein